MAAARRARSCSTSARSRAQWIEAMLLAAKAANAPGVPVVLDPVGAGATALPHGDAKRILDEVESRSCAAKPAEVATLAGVEAEIRGVESIGAAATPAPSSRAQPPRALGSSSSVTGPVDHVSDGGRTLAVANGHALLGDRSRARAACRPR